MKIKGSLVFDSDLLDLQMLFSNSYSTTWTIISIHWQGGAALGAEVYTSCELVGELNSRFGVCLLILLLWV